MPKDVCACRVCVVCVCRCLLGEECFVLPGGWVVPRLAPTLQVKCNAQWTWVHTHTHTHTVFMCLREKQTQHMRCISVISSRQCVCVCVRERWRDAEIETIRRLLANKVGLVGNWRTEWETKRKKAAHSLSLSFLIADSWSEAKHVKL